MQRAWQSDPSLRPSFEDIFQEVQTLLDAQVAREQTSETRRRQHAGKQHWVTRASA